MKTNTVLPRHLKLVLCLSIALTVFLVYLPVKDNGFINYDDADYVTENKTVQEGLTTKGIHWAFTTMHAGNWHPLTWLSHMTDCSLFGLKPAGHHLTSLFLHMLNALLLFLVLDRMTRESWRSAFVAALFALHPLHVESVAWVAERKDVLSTFFWLLSTGAYVLYVERPNLVRYGLVFAALALGLMAKPMLVTLPCALLLLDYWPLNRFRTPGSRPPDDGKTDGPDASAARGKKRKRSRPGETTPGKKASPPVKAETSWSVFRGLVAEKVPLFFLSAVSGIVTYIAQQKSGTVAHLEAYSIIDRLQNALVSYTRYLGKFFYPADLSVFYPYAPLPFWQIAGSALLLAAVTIFVVSRAKSRPYLLVGWCWYLGTLVPVIGIVKVGLQSMADRYTYIPSIGFFLLVAWGVSDLTGKIRRQSAILVVLAAAVLAGASIATWNQVQKWKNDPVLYGHALKIDENNHVAHFGLGLHYADKGDVRKAADHYARALRAMPTQPDYLNNMANILARQGKIEEAAGYYREAIGLQENNALAHFNLARLLAYQEKYEEAISHFRKTLEWNPEDSVAGIMLADLLSMTGKLDEALQHYARSLQIDPNRSDVHFAMGKILARQGKNGEAAVRFRKVLSMQPGHWQAHHSLGKILLSEGNIDEAIGHFREAVRVEPGSSHARKSLEDAVAAKKNLR